MAVSNCEIMTNARAALAGKWGAAAIVSLIYILASVVLGSVKSIGWIINLIITGPLLVGFYSFFLAVARRAPEVRIAQLWSGFSSFKNALVAYILMMVFVILWALLLIVPGVIAMFSYSMTFFILADNPTMDGYAALNASKAMMQGHKKRLLCLVCRFLGWILLSIVTFGIALIWVAPYLATSCSLFYDDLKSQAATGKATEVA